MSIASAITAAQGKVANAYTAVNNKGGTLPATQNLTNLATAVSSIPTGGSSPVISSLNITPTTSQQTITAPSGTDGYSPITVNAVTSSIDSNITANNIKKDVNILGVIGTYEGSGGGIGIPREVKNGVYQMPTENFTFSLPNNATDIGERCLYYAFYNCKGLTSVDLSSLTTVSGSYGIAYTFYGCTGLTGSLDLSSLATISGSYGLRYAFYGCTGLTSVDLSSLTTISDEHGLSNTFYNCTALTSVDLSSLTTIADNALNSAFRGCTALTSVDLSSLAAIPGNNGLSYAFYDCTALTSVDLPLLVTVSGGACIANAFYGCTALTDVYFRALTTSSFGSSKSQFNNMMSRTGSSVTHTIHFPSNLQSKISGLTGYPLFGGTSGKVVLSFDLPATS